VLSIEVNVGLPHRLVVGDGVRVFHLEEHLFACLFLLAGAPPRGRGLGFFLVETLNAAPANPALGLDFFMSDDVLQVPGCHQAM
jgi:hypothetical protein